MSKLNEPKRKLKYIHLCGKIPSQFSENLLFQTLDKEAMKLSLKKILLENTNYQEELTANVINFIAGLELVNFTNTGGHVFTKDPLLTTLDSLIGQVGQEAAKKARSNLASDRIGKEIINNLYGQASSDGLWDDGEFFPRYFIIDKAWNDYFKNIMFRNTSQFYWPKVKIAKEALRDYDCEKHTAEEYINSLKTQ